jgi:hypothetical protein
MTPISADHTNGFASQADALQHSLAGAHRSVEPRSGPGAQRERPSEQRLALVPDVPLQCRKR